MAISALRSGLSLLGIIVLLFSTLIIISCSEVLDESGSDKQLGVNELFADLESLTRTGDFEGATKRLEGIDVDSLFRVSVMDNRTQAPDPKKLVFLAFAEYMIHMPGIPLELDSEVWRRKDFLEVPGTGDDIPLSNGQLYQRWFDAVGSFVLKYNARVYREGVALGKFPALPLSATDVRRRLCLDEKAWKQLPIEVQVTLEIMVNERHQKSIDAARPKNGAKRTPNKG